MIEEDTIDILVFGDRDSVFLPPAKGQYLGLQFPGAFTEDATKADIHSAYGMILYM